MVLFALSSLVFAGIDKSITGESISCSSSYLFCDDFEDGTLNTSIWSVVGSPTYSESQGVLNNTATGSVSNLLASKYVLFNTSVVNGSTFTIEFKFSSTGSDSFLSELNPTQAYGGAARRLGLIGSPNAVALFDNASIFSGTYDPYSNITIRVNITGKYYKGIANINQGSNIIISGNDTANLGGDYYYTWVAWTGDINTMYYFTSWRGTPEQAPYKAPIITLTTGLNLNFVNQSPSDIRSLNAIGLTNITYNISSDNVSVLYPNVSTAFIYFKTNSSLFDNTIFINGTPKSGFRNESTVGNTSRDFYKFILDDNDIYPGVFNTNADNLENSLHQSTSLNNQNDYLLINFYNVSNYTQYNFLEVMANTSSAIPLNVYYCNSSYISGSVGSSNCANIGTINPNNNFNHTHNLSKHNLIQFTVNRGLINNVKVTQESNFILNPSTTGTWNVWNSSVVSREGNYKLSNNNGNSYINLSGTVDSHLHQYVGNEIFYYYACATPNGSINANCSAITTDVINLDILPPSAPNIIIPNQSNYNNQINITYTNVTTPQNTTRLSYFNISLLYSNGTFKSTITANNSNNIYYLYNTTVEPNSYLMKICAVDNVSLSSCSISLPFNISIGLNISVANYKTNSSVINFTINLTHIATGNSYYRYIADSTGYTVFNIINETGQYNVYINSSGFAYRNENLTLTSALNQSQLYYLYPKNSILFNIYEENSSAYIYQNSTVTFYNALLGGTVYTINGTALIENITASSYLVTVASNGYTSRSYTLTVGNDTWQLLNVYLSSSTTTTILNVKDEDTLANIDTALVTMYKQVNGTWTAIESKYTDVTGRAQFSYTAGVNYKFFLSKDNYVDYIFYLTPILFPNYDVLMKKSAVINTTQDYQDISLLFLPTSFVNNNATNFNFIIQSPSGKLVSYGYYIEYPGGNSTKTGNNAIGGQLTNLVNITGASITDRVHLVYYYETTTSNGIRNFSAWFPIGVTYGNNTMMSNNDSTYGLTVFERILISTVIIIFIVGIASLVGQIIPGLVLGLLSYGYLSIIGFIPLWSILLSFFIGFIVIQWRNG